MSNLQELLNGAIQYPNNEEGLLKFLEDIELDRSLKEEADKQGLQNSVTLITFHNTKGLEFKHVIMTGLEKGIFPRADKKDDDLEEERRLFYVGATRAMEELTFTTCVERLMFGRITRMEPSLFLREVDRDCVDIDDNHTNHHKRPVIGRNFNSLPLRDLRPATAELEKRAGRRRGERLFNQDHGQGAVVDIKDSEDGPIVYVHFDNGHKTKFLSEIQGRAYEKIGDDY